MMSKSTKSLLPHQFTYRLERIIQTHFSYSLPSKKPKSFNISYQVIPRITHNLQAERVEVDFKIIGVIHAESEEGKFEENVIFMDTLFCFNLKNLESYLVLDKDNKQVFDSRTKPILITFISLGVSSIRGMLFEKLRGSIYHENYLPIMDPKVFFKDKEG